MQIQQIRLVINLFLPLASKQFFRNFEEQTTSMCSLKNVEILAHIIINRRQYRYRKVPIFRTPCGLFVDFTLLKNFLWAFFT